jgi:hypothetical protein
MAVGMTSRLNSGRLTRPGGTNAQVRLQRVGKPGVTEIRTWGAHEKVSVKQATEKR